jgi:hypothetical protein
MAGRYTHIDLRVTTSIALVQLFEGMGQAQFRIRSALV